MNTILELMNELKTAFENDSFVSYNETVKIAEYKPENLPDFDIYCILISPVSDFENLIANRVKEKICKVEINCVVRNFDEQDSLLASGDISGNVGIIKFANDVRKTLHNYGEANKDRLTILYDETDEPVNYKKTVKIPEREGFFREVTVPYKVRLEREYF